jgi:SAM-dependent methyltransferase
VESEGEALQKAHYDGLAAAYAAHYDDDFSRAYRRRFLYPPLFAGVGLAGTTVLEAMCGSGQTTEFLRAGGARVTGLDISEAEIAAFRTRWPDCRGVRASILDSGLPSASFDHVVVIGGLHHVQPDVGAAVREIHRVLRAGGFFCFAEPHAGSVPDLARRYWYRRDSLFTRNEAAIDLDSLKREFASGFRFDGETYLGNVAYLLVFNSMVFRIPVRLKPFYSRPLLACEAAIGRLQSRRLSCVVAARWVKR